MRLLAITGYAPRPPGGFCPCCNVRAAGWMDKVNPVAERPQWNAFHPKKCWPRDKGKPPRYAEFSFPRDGSRSTRGKEPPVKCIPPKKILCLLSVKWIPPKKRLACLDHPVPNSHRPPGFNQRSQCNTTETAGPRSEGDPVGRPGTGTAR